jgi:Trk K+ transport system NAD-binding subunit
MKAVVAGPDRGLGDALDAEGVDVSRVTGLVTLDALEAAGIADADVFVLTDVSEATSIPVALDANPDLKVVVYAPETMPEFVRGQVDLALDPAVMPVETVAEELAA